MQNKSRQSVLFIFMPEAPPVLFKDSASREECKIKAAKARFLFSCPRRRLSYLKIVHSFRPALFFHKFAAIHRSSSSMPPVLPPWRRAQENARSCPTPRRALRNAPAYFAASTRVLSAKYATESRKASSRLALLFAPETLYFGIIMPPATPLFSRICTPQTKKEYFCPTAFINSL